jgi:hypothetical protein
MIHSRGTYLLADEQAQFRVRVLVIIEDSTVTEMQKNNKSVVPLLSVMLIYIHILSY